jgi:hypothetical protein
MVAAALVGSAVVGAAASKSASKKASKASQYAVDTSREASDRQADLAERQYDDYVTHFQPKILSGMENADRMAQAAEARTAEQFAFDRDQSAKYADRYWGRQVPLEDQIIDRARNYDTEANRERLAGMAMADVQSGFDNAFWRGLQRMGVNPNDGKFAAMSNQNAIALAAQRAGAANSTRFRAEEIASAKLNEAAALGRGLPGFQTNSSQMALGWNNANANAGAMGMNAAVQGSGANNAAYSTGSNLWGASSNTAINGLNAYNNTFSSFAQHDPMQGVYGSIAGLGTGYAGMKLGIPMGAKT